jgi:hypothetical protein
VAFIPEVEAGISSPLGETDAVEVEELRSFSCHFCPSCQVRVVRFYVSWPSPPPDLSYKRWMKAILAGPRTQRRS